MSGSSNEFLEEAIFDRLPSRSRPARTGFTNFDCPMCTDRRSRCGVKPSIDGSLVISCFNCGFQAGWSPGYNLSEKLRDFLAALGLSAAEIVLLALRAAKLRGSIAQADSENLFQPKSHPCFETMALPQGSRSIFLLLEEGCTDQNLLDVHAYLQGRGSAIADHYDCYWSPCREHGLYRRVIVPFWFDGCIIGWTARTIDADHEPRYYSKTPPNALFSLDQLYERKRQHIMLFEGVMDAIALNGVALLGSKINETQLKWLRASQKQILLVPDLDDAGLRLIDVAVKEGWSVSFPWGDWWHPKVKDAAQASELYGRLWAITAILQCATNNPAAIAAQQQRVMSLR